MRFERFEICDFQEFMQTMNVLKVGIEHEMSKYEDPQVVRENISYDDWGTISLNRTIRAAGRAAERSLIREHLYNGGTITSYSSDSDFSDYV